MDTRQTPGGDPARQLAAMLAEFDRHRGALERRATLGTADMRLLWLLLDGPARTLREIADELSLEQSTVNRQVNAAVHNGLVSKQTDSPSRRYRFTATSRGAREFERNLDASMAAYRSALAAVGRTTPSFLELMADFVDAYRAAVDADDATGGASRG